MQRESIASFPIFSGVIFVMLLSLSGNWAHAEDIAISASVVQTATVAANPIVQFIGIASPGAKITVKRGRELVTTSSADAQAKFDITLADQPEGKHTYEIAALDATGDSLAPLTFALDLKSGTTTIMSGVFLGPSIEVDTPSVKLGENVNVFGATAPKSKVTITVSSTSTKTFTIEADAAGKWKKPLATGDLGVGTHTAKARAVTQDNVVSSFSSSVSFAVNALDPAEGKKPADINTDGKVNLIDFSILLFYWKQKNPANPRADINGDRVVDLVDFSILLYQWDGK